MENEIKRNYKMCGYKEEVFLKMIYLKSIKYLYEIDKCYSNNNKTPGFN